MAAYGIFYAQRDAGAAPQARRLFVTAATLRPQRT